MDSNQATIAAALAALNPEMPAAQTEHAARLTAASLDHAEYTVVKLPSAQANADDVRRAGWRPPARGITTAAELDALPNGAIVVAAATGKPWQRDRMSWVAHRGHLYSHELFGRYGALTLVSVPTEKASRG
ncbi:hypothetical protein ACFO5K_04270 [Nocardia halotolerans]|uniref:Uncharacterized protein n=1 Tax=Nocardia halotolerans TaxID=1755878 RepID=A0ABV8VCT0_9NOCA